MNVWPNVAVVGRAGSGKTTASQFMVDQLGYRRLSFAAPLKRIAAELWDEPGRYELQSLGMAVRDIHENTWVDLMRNLMQSQRKQAAAVGASTTHPWVIDDCRFPNEYEMLAGEGFKFLGLDVPQDVQIGRLTQNGRFQSIEQLSHKSETALDDFHFDAYYFNTGDVVGLYDAIIDFVEANQLR